MSKSYNKSKLDLAKAVIKYKIKSLGEYAKQHKIKKNTKEN